MWAVLLLPCHVVPAASDGNLRGHVPELALVRIKGFLEGPPLLVEVLCQTQLFNKKLLHMAEVKLISTSTPKLPYRKPR